MVSAWLWSLLNFYARQHVVQARFGYRKGVRPSITLYSPIKTVEAMITKIFTVKT